MSSRAVRALALTAWLLCGIFPAAALGSRTLSSPGSPFIVDIWGIEDGLPQSSLISIVQTHNGYLWLGTLNGLARFDGMKFTVFDEANMPGLNDVRIVHLFEDSQSNLWVGTESAGVMLIGNDGTTRHFDLGAGSPGGKLISACEDSHGTVWLLMANGVLGSFQNGKLTVSAVPGCKAVMAEKSGPLWLGTDHGLFAVAKAGPTAFVVQQMLPVSGRLDFLLASKSGGYWRLADGRIQKWKGAQLERDLGEYPWKTTPVMAACEDPSGNLVVGTYGDGVYWFNARGGFIHLLNELSHSSVLSLTFDRQGDLWIGTNGGGLDRVRRKIFHVLAGSEGIPVQSASQDAQGDLWVGYNGDRIDQYARGKTQQFTPAAEAPNSYVKSVFVDRDQHVWAGMWFAGASDLFRLDSGRFRRVAVAGVPLGDVSAIYQDHNGVLWIGTQNGLACPAKKRLFTTREGPPANDVRAIAENAQGDLWIGTGGGLARFHDGHFTVFHKKDGLPSDDISSLLVDRDDVLWVGTRGSGLARFFNNRWTHYTTGTGLTGNGISYLVPDNEGNLWLGSNAGLMRVSKKTLNDFAEGKLTAIDCRTYVEADGMPTRECTQGSQPAACAGADGTLWFPTTKGLAFVKPAQLKPDPFQPPVVIESVLIDGREQNTNRFRAEPSQIAVPPGSEYLEIHYTSLNLGAARQSRFRYRFADHKTGWRDVGSLREVRFPKLPPGDYHFEVAACNEDGIWNPQPATLSILVEPAFWQTVWFRVLVGALLAGLLAAVIYYWSTQRLQREVAILKHQEEMERERARIARDLHDQIGANLTQVALLGELAGSDREHPEEVEDHARQISQTARETTRALDEIVWAVNPSNDTLDGLITYACKYAQEFFQLAGLRYRLEVPAQLPPAIVAPEVRHNVFLAFKEAVNNVVKHARATEARIRLHLEPGRFTLEIEDDGRGPAGLEAKTGRSGLRNMRSRMESIGGRFTIGPAGQKGTLVQLTAPLTSDKLTP